jgi:2-succinyl-6-hydroxy-2,4-cyclohexadiene-1-carboxylate synthase
MPTINLLGVRHTYDFVNLAQTQPALVFVHGWLLSRHYWQPFIQSFAKFHPCLSYDLRGFGESDCQASNAQATLSPLTQAHLPLRQENPYTLAAYAVDLLELLEQLQLSKVWLVGHSLGGSIALWAATLAPDRVQGVVCLNAGGGIYLKEDFDRFRNAGQQMLKFRQNWFANVPFLNLLFSRMMVTQPLAAKWGTQRLKDFLVAHPEAALRSLLDSTTPEEVYQLPQLVAKLQQPTYFIAGQQDSVMELRYVYHLASFHHSFQDGQTNVIEVPDCGHFAMLEQAEQVIETLTNLLETHRATGRNLSSQSATS